MFGEDGGGGERGGGRLLFVSHNMIIIQNLCDTGFLLENGKITGHGQMSDVVEKYLNNPDFEDISYRDISDIPRRKGEGEHFKYHFCFNKYD